MSNGRLVCFEGFFIHNVSHVLDFNLLFDWIQRKNVVLRDDITDE
jgi:hypothetical protein